MHRRVVLVALSKINADTCVCLFVAHNNPNEYQPTRRNLEKLTAHAYTLAMSWGERYQTDEVTRHITIHIGYQPTIFAITTGQRVVLLTRKQQNQ